MVKRQRNLQSKRESAARAKARAKSVSGSPKAQMSTQAKPGPGRVQSVHAMSPSPSSSQSISPIPDFDSAPVAKNPVSGAPRVSMEIQEQETKQQVPITLILPFLAVLFPT